jgi:hypothetical protein
MSKYIRTYVVLKCILCSCECFMYVTIYIRTYFNIHLYVTETCVHMYVCKYVLYVCTYNIRMLVCAFT